MAARSLWQQRAGMGGFNGGVHWGMASDSRTLFVGIADTPGNKGAVGPRRPGVHAFDVVSGKPLWSRIEPDTCNEMTFKCHTALSAPVTLTDGIVFGGAHNGLLARLFGQGRCACLWSFDTSARLRHGQRRKRRWRHNRFRRAGACGRIADRQFGL